MCRCSGRCSESCACRRTFQRDVGQILGDKAEIRHSLAFLGNFPRMTIGVPPGVTEFSMFDPLFGLISRLSALRLMTITPERRTVLFLCCPGSGLSSLVGKSSAFHVPSTVAFSAIIASSHFIRKQNPHVLLARHCLTVFHARACAPGITPPAWLINTVHLDVDIAPTRPASRRRWPTNAIRR